MKLLVVEEWHVVVHVICNHKDAVLKMESAQSIAHCQGRNEVSILQAPYLGRMQGIPRVLWSGVDENISRFIYISTPFGTPMSEIVSSRQVNEETAKDWAFSLVRLLKRLHICGFVHRDVKPANIIFCNNRMSLIDFGLACRIGTEYDGFVGTKRYASTAALKGEGQASGIDDLESACWTILHALNGSIAASKRPSLSRVRRQYPVIDAMWRAYFTYRPYLPLKYLPQQRRRRYVSKDIAKKRFVCDFSRKQIKRNKRNS